MVFAQGTCPNCGAPLEFAIGSSISKVCEYCRHTVVRTDRGFTPLGKVADLAPTSSLVGIGDQGTLGGRPIEILGRVQLDHGSGPWDEYYVAFDHGQAWGWLAYAQGRWHTTMLVPALPLPAFGELLPERDVLLGQAGGFRIAEVRSARVVSAEGELPESFPVGFVRYYADVHGLNSAFGTLDYGNLEQPPSVYLGWIFPESALAIVQLGPRSAHRVQTSTIQCASCGGDVPALSGGRAERLGCPYCGAVTDIPERTVVFRQDVARKTPTIPIGSRGTLGGVEYVCVALIRRGSDFDGVLYEWEEYLLFSHGNGYSWLVRDPETGWSKVHAVNIAELDLSEMPAAVRWMDRRYTARNENDAVVTHVLGEVYWKCQVGEATHAADFEHQDDVLSREASSGEVNWSYSRRIPWPVIATAFGLPMNAPGGRVAASGSGSSISPTVVMVAIVVILLIGFAVLTYTPSPPSPYASSGSGTGVTTGSGTFRGGGIFSGGK